VKIKVFPKFFLHKKNINFNGAWTLRFRDLVTQQTPVRVLNYSIKYVLLTSSEQEFIYQKKAKNMNNKNTASPVKN